MTAEQTARCGLTDPRDEHPSHAWPTSSHSSRFRIAYRSSCADAPQDVLPTRRNQGGHAAPTRCACARVHNRGSHGRASRESDCAHVAFGTTTMPRGDVALSVAMASNHFLDWVQRVWPRASARRVPHTVADRAELQDRHDRRVRRVASLLANRESKSPVSLRKQAVSHQVPKAGDLRRTDEKIDISDFNDILHIDVDRAHLRQRPASPSSISSPRRSRMGSCRWWFPNSRLSPHRRSRGRVLD